jgi:AbrB family looped-hinge helix DNA binding protein
MSQLMEATMQIEHVKLGDDCRLVIPATIRKEVGLKPGDTVVIESDGDSLLLRSYEQVLREVQEAFAPFRLSGGSIADELIAERRAEAAAEDAEPNGRGRA